MECEEHFDELVRSEQQVVTCPSCGAAKVLKQLSAFAVIGARPSPASPRARAAAGAAAAAAAAATEACRAAVDHVTRSARPAGSGRTVSAMSAELPATLREVASGAAGCVRCALHAGRTQVVFGEGDPEAELALVGEAPGFHEDRDGLPFAGRARELLERLLGGIGLRLDEVYLATVLKCRPPGNRDPLPEEIGRLRALPLPPARTRPAASRRDPRQLRDRAPLRPCARDHARPRPGARR